MAIAIQPYTEQWIPAVKAFNQRLAAGGIAPEFHFPESHIPSWLPKLEGRRIYQEFYLATDSDAVRGAYILKFQDFFVGGKIQPVAYYHLPISEGIVNKMYSSIGVHMLRSAIKAQPMLYCLGMGGVDRPLPRMLKAMGWSLSGVPFFFKVNNTPRFLRHMAPLRESALNRRVCDLAAVSGAGAIAINLLQRIHSKRKDRSVTVESVSSFGEWADVLWREYHSHYKLVGTRDAANLKVLYPPDKNFLVIKVSRGAEVLGWAVMLDTQMQNNKYFGNLRVGSIADCMASPDNAQAVIQAASQFLQERGVDLMVCNQSHAAWSAALKSNGFLQGPSNFIFAASKALGELLAPFERNKDQIYFMRGDGDGPVNL
jgi:hypothetical protein